MGAFLLLFLMMRGGSTSAITSPLILTSRFSAGDGVTRIAAGDGVRRIGGIG